MSGSRREPSHAAVFSATADGARWTASGALNFANAAAVLAAAGALPLPASGLIACDELAPVDSAAVAVLLALKRRAAKEGRTLRFENLPLPLHALATVYGVDPVLAG